MNELKNELKKKQNKLKIWIKKLGLNQKIFAERIFYTMNESDNEEEIKRFYEKFKKDINRKSTKIERIDSYLKILYQQKEFEQLELIKLENHCKDFFDDNFNREMKNISRKINDKLLKED